MTPHAGSRSKVKVKVQGQKVKVKRSRSKVGQKVKVKVTGYVESIAYTTQYYETFCNHVGRENQI